ncbi:hypothetical protein ACU686_38660 [Yinghuangia aomiensis]
MSESIFVYVSPRSALFRSPWRTPDDCTLRAPPHTPRPVPPRAGALLLTACGDDGDSKPPVDKSAPLYAKVPEKYQKAQVIKVGSDVAYAPNELLRLGRQDDHRDGPGHRGRHQQAAGHPAPVQEPVRRPDHVAQLQAHRA